MKRYKSKIGNALNGKRSFFGTADTVLISNFFGVETGKKVNKIEKAGCHDHKCAHVNAPIIDEYPLTLECRVRSWDPKRVTSSAKSWRPRQTKLS